MAVVFYKRFLCNIEEIGLIVNDTNLSHFSVIVNIITYILEYKKELCIHGIIVLIVFN